MPRDLLLSSDPLSLNIMRALGVDPNICTRVEVVFEVGSFVKITHTTAVETYSYGADIQIPISPI